MLIVGEGYAEKYFLLHLRSIYTANRLGPHLTVVNARGKGAANVIDTAITQAGQYDSAGALFDTDTDWDEKVAARARKHGIQVFPATPCIEAMLLDIAGIRPAETTAENKQLFRIRYKDDAHREGLIARNFNRDSFEAARIRVETLSRILTALA